MGRHVDAFQIERTRRVEVEAEGLLVALCRRGRGDGDVERIARIGRQACDLVREVDAHDAGVVGDDPARDGIVDVDRHRACLPGLDDLLRLGRATRLAPNPLGAEHRRFETGEGAGQAFGLCEQPQPFAEERVEEEGDRPRRVEVDLGRHLVRLLRFVDRRLNFPRDLDLQRWIGHGRRGGQADDGCDADRGLLVDELDLAGRRVDRVRAPGRHHAQQQKLKISHPCLPAARVSP